MNNVKRIVVNILVVALLIMLITITFCSVMNIKAESETSSYAQINITELLLDGYENEPTESKKIFNPKALTDLFQSLSGEENADISTILKKLDTNGAMTSADIRKLNKENDIEKDIVVTLGGKQWYVTYVTKVGEEVVVDLWLADADKDASTGKVITTKWNSSYDSKKGTYPSNMYGISKIRAEDLNNGGNYWTGINNNPIDGSNAPSNVARRAHRYAMYTMPKSEKDTSITEFLLKPSQVPYQGSNLENAKFSSNAVVEGCTVSNDSYNSITDANWYNEGEYNFEGIAGYDNWADDYLWLPSLSEVGDGDGINGIWEVSLTQKKSSSGTWLRSASYHNYKGAYYLQNAGTIYGDNVNTSYAIRPAIHLNLSKVAKHTQFSVSEPIDVSVEYTGMQMSLNDVAEEEKLWYNPNIMDIESVSMIDAKSYMIKATINSNAQTNGFIFEGTPKTDNTEYQEDEITRYFQFTITKKKIGVDVKLNNTSKLPYVELKNKGDIYSGDKEEDGRAPNLGFNYSSTDGKGYNSDTLPTAIGAYRATAKILNEECNYVLDDTYYIDFSIDKTPVDKPSIATKEKTYTGEDITFNLAQYSDKVSVSITSVNGKSAVHKDGVITVKDADTYTVSISLADNGKATCWNTSTTDDIASYTIEIKVTQKKLNTSIACSDTDFSWEVGEQVTFTIADERISGDSIDYYVYYLKSGDTTKYDDIDSTKQIVGGSVTVTMPSDLGIGIYTFVVELRKNSTSSDNGNYYIDGDSKTATFSIVGNGITVTANDIKWKVNNVDIGQLTNGKLPLTYSGSAFRFSVDESNLKALGVKIDTSKGTKGLEGDIEQTNVGTSYSIKVWLCNYDNTYDTYSGSFTLNYEIKQAKYDMSKVKWDYTDGALKYNANYQTVTLTGLPSTLTVVEDGYDGNRQRNAGEDYVASVLGFNNTDSNYMTPLYDKPETYEGDFDWTLTWSIGKATLTLEWESVDTQDSAGNAYKLPKVKGENAQFVDGNKYRYYKSSGVSVGDEINLEDILVGESAVRYWVEAVLTDNAAVNYEISEATKRISFKVGMDGEKITVDLEAQSFTYDGNAHGGELRVIEGTMKLERIIKTYYRGSVSESNRLDGAPTDAGDYIVVLSLSEADEEDFALTRTQITFSIAKAKITAKWDTSGQTPEIANLSESQKAVVGYIYYDSEGNELQDGAQLEAGKTYSVKAILTGDNAKNYEFVSEEGEVLPNETETEVKDFTIGSNGGSGNVIGGVDSGNNPGSGNNSGGTLDEIL
ncbi:MAG: hypothetical protein K2K85_03960, partial [Clostridia bacterium]|nr:hypothetical protein [Clostridia bacterium]